MTRKEAIIKAKKIHALVVGGATEGERAAATNRLEALMKNHALTWIDLGASKAMPRAADVQFSEDSDFYTKYKHWINSPHADALVSLLAEMIKKAYYTK